MPHRLIRLPAAAPLVGAVVLLAGCGSGGVSVAKLAQRQGAFVGKRVQTQGVVREEHDVDGSTYYVLSDGAGDLVGLKPRTSASRYAGLRVTVRGRFEVQPGFGRVIVIATIHRR